jgi:PHP family Zn ribbon phosphoesterase
MYKIIIVWMCISMLLQNINCSHHRKGTIIIIGGGGGGGGHYGHQQISNSI